MDCTIFVEKKEQSIYTQQHKLKPIFKKKVNFFIYLCIHFCKLLYFFFFLHNLFFILSFFNTYLQGSSIFQFLTLTKKKTIQSFIFRFLFFRFTFSGSGGTGAGRTGTGAGTSKRNRSVLFFFCF